METRNSSNQTHVEGGNSSTDENLILTSKKKAKKRDKSPSKY